MFGIEPIRIIAIYGTGAYHLAKSGTKNQSLGWIAAFRNRLGA